MCAQGAVDSVVAGREAGGGVQKARVAVFAQRAAGELEPSPAERRRRGRPGGAVAVASVGARLGAQAR